ncbi:uncharacterized protein LOC135475319 [Liolophura sinensis]|uniref:uncharacterized protein LOC135475319 n=1 Tax=Liolophura sinensis TaxID=3198878 RepID=UPI003158240C
MFAVKALPLAVVVVLLGTQAVRTAPKAGKAPTGLAPEEVFKEVEVKGKPKAIKIEQEKFKPSVEGEKRYSDNSHRLSERSTETCTEEYKKRPGHTMCMTDLPNIEESGLKDGDSTTVVNDHNKFRGIVEPPATDMPKMIWNEQLAAVAQKWANQCQLEHDDDRSLVGFTEPVGQNVAAGHLSWSEAIKAWYDEISDWKYGVDPETYLPDGVMIGHFTQMVSNATTLIGCGYASCSETYYTRYYVCNYLIGQSTTTKMYPYTKGERCAACPQNCKEGVCDCGGKFCKNQGKIDPGTCECSCPVPFKGDVCTDVACPPSDPPACGTTFLQAQCKYSYVRKQCPYMCDLCTEENKKIFEDVELGTGIKVNGFDYFKSKHGCPFYGTRPSKEECKTYGNKGADQAYACATGSGSYGCDACVKFSNVATDYCPVMCGYCDERDLSAVNDVKPGTGTTIDGEPFFKSLQGCPFWGPRPSADECASYGEGGKDKSFCSNAGCDACEKYSEMGTDYCPAMCGLCDP